MEDDEAEGAATCDAETTADGEAVVEAEGVVDVFSVSAPTGITGDSVVFSRASPCAEAEERERSDALAAAFLEERSCFPEFGAMDFSWEIGISSTHPLF